MISKINKENEKLPEETKRSLNIISNLSNYIVFLISDIIHYINNKDVKSLRVNFSTIDFKELSEFCFQILESLLFCNITKKEKIKTRLIFDEKINLVETESDETRIKQILLNLISNSVKFTNEGEIILKCKLKKIKGKLFIKICVSDTGIGIKSEDIDKLFNEFVQLDSINTENIKLGSGLGLSICKNIAKRLGIKLDIRSEYKKGTKIFMLIPVISSDNNINLFENCNYYNLNKKLSFIKENINNISNNKSITNSFSENVISNSINININDYNPNDIININIENNESLLIKKKNNEIKSLCSDINNKNNNNNNINMNNDLNNFNILYNNNIKGKAGNVRK
jgi:anti-sigma regulatory factor (Ser/Thr protein kinase)